MKLLTRKLKETSTILLFVGMAVVFLAARPGPQQDGWEYSVFVGADDGRAAYVSADTILIDSNMMLLAESIGVLDSPSFPPEDERWGTVILNHLGAEGWELTAVEAGGFRGDNLGPLDEAHRTYYLKRARYGGGGSH